MHLRSAIAVAASVVILLAVPARGQDVPRYLATCIRTGLSPEGCGPGRPKVGLKVKISPERLPRHEFAPVGLTVSGSVGTEDGGHPSALREATSVINEGIRVDTERLAACPRRRLEHMDVPDAQSACREAIVGRGVAQIGLASSEKKLRVPLTLFNGGTSGNLTRLFIRGATGATGGALVAVGQIRRGGRGLEVTWRLPRIVDGDGSLLSFKLEVGRVFAEADGQHSYLSGSCPDGKLQASVPELTFVNEAHTPGLASRTVLRGGLAVPCAPRR